MGKTILKKKNLVLIVSFLLALFVTTITINNDTVSSKSKPELVIMHSDLSDSFEDINDLYKKSDIVALVKSNAANSFMYEEVPFTINDVKIKRLYKGENIKNIEFLEVGGIINDIEYAVEGNKVLKTDEEALVFLVKYEGPILKNGYVVLGGYQGKYMLKNDTTLIPPNESDKNLNKIDSIEQLPFK